MKTPEEFVKEYYQLPQSKIKTVRIKSLIQCIERYLEYHDIKVEKLNIPAVLGRSEQCVLHSTDWYGTCFKCGQQVFIRDKELNALPII